MAVLWGDISDSVIADVDKKMASKWKISIRELLTNPARYAKTANVATTVGNMKEAVDNYVENALVDMKSEKDALEDSVEKADALTGQLSQNINMQTKQNKVPLIKPVLIDRDYTKDEIIYFNSVDNGVLSLIEKLCMSSTFVADYSANYKNYKLGEWLFSGQKNYIVKAYMPPNDVLGLQAAKEELDGLFDAAATLLSGA